MKKKDESVKQQTNFEKLQKFFEDRFDSVEKQIQQINKQVQTLDYNQKVSDQKNDNSFKDLRYRIVAEAASTRQNIEQTLRAEIQVANTELKKELNKRITYIADLITIQLGGKVQNHEKRINKLEKAQQIA